MPLTRREFMVASAGLVVGACAGGKGNSAKAPVKNAAPGGSSTTTTAVWTPQTGLALTEPVQVFANKGGVLTVALDAEAEPIPVSGATLGCRPWNGALIGPTLNVAPGDRIELTFKNGMDQVTNIHYHGLHVSPLGDGDNVFRTFLPGKTYHSAIDIPHDHNVGTYWYHVHFHGVSEGQVMGGLSGLLLIHGIEDRLPPDLQQIKQRQLAIRDVRTRGGSIVLDPSTNTSTDTFTLLVNGLAQPTFSIAQGETQLWHLANIGADAFYNVALNGPSGASGMKFTIIGIDGAPVWNVQTLDSLDMPPARRYDVLVQGGAPGTYSLATLGYPNAPKPRDPGPLATVTVTPGTGAPAVLPTTMMSPQERAQKDLRNFPATGPSHTVAFSFSQSGDSDVSIDGGPPQVFDPNRLDVAVKLNDVEDWTLLNNTGQPHPFHIHVNEFQVLQVQDPTTGQMVPYDAPGTNDTFTMPPQITVNGQTIPGKIVIRNRYLDFDGWFVFHCHILNHEDGGMMSSIEVLKPGQKPSPPPHDSKLTSQHLAHTNVTEP
jgi:FtsP/CotA-like multicopper oxidase with cupredoxin domain